MADWPCTRAKRVLAALLRKGWRIKRQWGSHRTLAHEVHPELFIFHDRELIGLRMLAQIAKKTGLTPEDL